MYLVLLGSENVLIWLRSAMSQIIMRGRIVGKCFRESESLIRALILLSIVGRQDRKGITSSMGNPNPGIPSKLPTDPSTSVTEAKRYERRKLVWAFKGFAPTCCVSRHKTAGRYERLT